MPWLRTRRWSELRARSEAEDHLGDGAQAASGRAVGSPDSEGWAELISHSYSFYYLGLAYVSPQCLHSSHFLDLTGNDTGKNPLFAFYPGREAAAKFFSGHKRGFRFPSPESRGSTGGSTLPFLLRAGLPWFPAETFVKGSTAFSVNTALREKVLLGGDGAGTE